MGGRVQIGALQVDALGFDEAIERILALVGHGGAVFTPNVDHVVQAEEDERLRAAYADASLSLADGMPLLWAARLFGTPLPAKVSGSDLVLPLVDAAATRGHRIYLLGAGPGVAEQAAVKLRARGAIICGVDAPMLRDPRSAAERAPIVERIRAAAPDLLFVAFGAPKQELFIHHARRELGSVVALGIGASLDFITGAVKRAPRWMSRAGLEWLYRLMSEPRRLWRRYLVRDPAFVAIVLRQLRGRTSGRLLPKAP